MLVHQAIRNRRTIHQFEPSVVPKEALDRALEAATWAPCHRLTWPWRFTVVGPQTREKILTLATEVSAKKKGKSIEDLGPIIRSKLGRSGAMVIPRQVLADDPYTRDEDHATCSIAIGNFCLSLFADGLYTKWSTTSTVEDPRLYSMLNLEQDQERILGFLLVGQPARIPSTPERPPVDTVVTYTP